MTSWLDTKSFVTALAKTAMAEAQKTIDRALVYEADGVGDEAANPDDPHHEEQKPGTATRTGAASLSSSFSWGSFSGITMFEAASPSKGVSEVGSVATEQPRMSGNFGARSEESAPRTGDLEATPIRLDLSRSSFSANQTDLSSSNFGAESPSIVVDTTLNQSSSSSNALMAVSSESSSSSSILINPSSSVNSGTALKDSDELTCSSTVSSSHTAIACSGEDGEEAAEGHPPEEGRDEQDQTKTSSSSPASEGATSSSSKSYELLSAKGDHCPDSATTSGLAAAVEKQLLLQGSDGVAKAEESQFPDCNTKTGSGHSSGDDFDVITTATSSDIEVISSPVSEKGIKAIKSVLQDQHQKHQHHQPQSGSKSKTSSIQPKSAEKGHARTSSDMSSTACSEESYQSEAERLAKKLSEATEILDAREAKLVEMSRQNFELQEKNMDLISQVKEAMQINTRLQESALSSDEFTQRLATMEKRLHQVSSEKDRFKAENDALKKDLSTRLSKVEFDQIMVERDEIISELRSEGETLSRQAGKHSEIIKTLRAKERGQDRELTSTKEKLEKKTEECERLKKSLSAKDKVETKQIEAVRGLTAANSKWEEDAKRLTIQLNNANDHLAALKLNLESLYKENTELKRDMAEKEDADREDELAKEAEARLKAQDRARELEEARRVEVAGFTAQIEDLRENMQSQGRMADQREARLKRERDELMHKLALSEERHVELSGNVAASSRPLLRQIESLQASLNDSRSTADKVERSLAERLQQATLQLAATMERERNAAEQYRLASTQAATLETRMNAVKATLADTVQKMGTISEENRKLLEDKAKQESSVASVRRSFSEEISDLKREKTLVAVALDHERSKLADEKAKNASLQEQLKDSLKRLGELEGAAAAEFPARILRGSMSPPPADSSSFGRYGHVGRVSSSPSFVKTSGGLEQSWMDDVFETSSVISSKAEVPLAGGVCSSSTLLESLQAHLKQREGELMQRQLEISGLERIKEGLHQELLKMTKRADLADQLEVDVQKLKHLYTETDQKYQTILTMYGEKVEETEELRLDLQDVKEMYKVQIEELVRSKK